MALFVSDWKGTDLKSRPDRGEGKSLFEYGYVQGRIHGRWGALLKEQIYAQKLNCQDRGDSKGKFQVTGLVPEQVHSCQRAKTSAQRC